MTAICTAALHLAQILLIGLPLIAPTHQYVTGMRKENYIQITWTQLKFHNLIKKNLHKTMVEAWALSSVVAFGGMVFFTKELQLFDLSC